MPKGSSTPQPSGLIAEYLYSICRHGEIVANCGTCRPKGGAA